MNFLDLFSGIGGFALAAQQAGWKFKNHYFSEVDPFCVELYKKRFPDSIPMGDITKIKTEELPQGEWIVTGGFPCQDISYAKAKAKGINGDKSGLWFEMHRVIRELRPRWAIIENSSALCHRGLQTILSAFAEMRYDVEWQIIPAYSVGLPHNRHRLWLVSYPDQNGRQLQTLPQSTIQRDLEDHGESRIKAQTLRSRSEWERTEWGKLLDYESLVCRVDHGISVPLDRLEALGNSLVPPIPRLIFQRLKTIYLHETSQDNRTINKDAKKEETTA